MLSGSLCSFCFAAGAFDPRTFLTVLQFVCAHLQACMTAACVHRAPQLVWPLLKRKACRTADKVRGNCRFSASFSAEFQGKQRNRESPENRLSYYAASPPPEAHISFTAAAFHFDLVRRSDDQPYRSGLILSDQVQPEFNFDLSRILTQIVTSQNNCTTFIQSRLISGIHESSANCSN